MRSKFVIPVVILSLSLIGCSSGVSQEQFESVVAERDEYKAQLESISAALDELSNIFGGTDGTTSDETTSDETTSDETISDETQEQTENESNEPQKVELVKSGWTTDKRGDYTHVYYGVEIKNPNDDYAITFPVITITARDTDGKILKNDEMTLNSIAAGDTITYGNDIFYEGEIPASVDISVSNSKNNYKKQDETKYVSTEVFVIENTSENKDSFNTKYTGEITNNSDVDFSDVAVSVVYRLNGELVGGSTGYVDDVESGMTKVFEISSDYELEYDSYELHAIQW